jgi:N utilization substance protein A
MIDPVGACVGARGSRVRNITNELRSERIDVVPYSDDPIEFIQAALQPARVREVRLDEEEGIATVIVHDQQLSLAIGKEGQNARLAARLTGWRIDIRSENEGQEEAAVVEEVWTDGDVVVDETTVVIGGDDGEVAAVVVDEVITDAQGDVEEVVVVDVIEPVAEIEPEVTDEVVEDEA